MCHSTGTPHYAGSLIYFFHHRWFEGFNWEGLRKGTLVPPIIPDVSIPHPHLQRVEQNPNKKLLFNSNV